MLKTDLLPYCQYQAVYLEKWVDCALSKPVGIEEIAVRPATQSKY